MRAASDHEDDVETRSVSIGGRTNAAPEMPFLQGTDRDQLSDKGQLDMISTARRLYRLPFISSLRVQTAAASDSSA